VVWFDGINQSANHRRLEEVVAFYDSLTPAGTQSGALKALLDGADIE